MSAARPSGPPARAEGERWLVPQARRPIPFARVLLLLPLTAVYALLASWNSTIGGSAVAVASLSLLFLFTSAVAVAAPNSDLLEPRRVISFYYCIVFCIAPLADQFLDWDFRGDLRELVAAGAAFALGAYVMTMVGYHLPFFRRLPEAIPAQHRGYSSSVGTWLGLAIFAVGVVAYPLLILRLGGFAKLVFSEEGRSTWSVGFGWLFWFCFFMFPGATLFFASRAAKLGRRTWLLSALPGFLSFSMFLTLQGRMRALNGLILIAFASHYLVRPLRIWRVFAFGAAGLVLAFFVGFARAPSVRQGILTPSVVIGEMSEDFAPLLRVFIVTDLSRLRQLALILGKVPDVMPYDWGKSFLVFMNPFFRLTGLNRAQIMDVNTRLFRLAHPDIGRLETGYLPSIQGEMLVNFPWYLALFTFVPYGAGLRLVYQRLILVRGDFASISLYAILTLFGANMLLHSFGHVLLELAIFTFPLFIARAICGMFGGAPVGTDALPNASHVEAGRSALRSRSSAPSAATQQAPDRRKSLGVEP